MYSDIDEQVILERDCEATLIPFGNKITLKKGEEGHITLPIKDYPKMGRMMIDLLKDFPQMCFRFDCSFPPCLMDDINENEHQSEEIEKELRKLGYV